MPRKQRIPWDAASLHRLEGHELRKRADDVADKYPRVAQWLRDASVAASGRRYELLGTVSAMMVGRDE